MRSYMVTEFGEPLSEIETPTPEPKGSEVLLRITASGVCHSDLHIWQGYFDLGGGNRAEVRDRGVTPPRTLGHEIFGEVEAVGPEARGVEVHTYAGSQICVNGSGGPTCLTRPVRRV